MFDPTVQKRININKKMEKLQYPEAYRDESIIDNYHGIEVRIINKFFQ